MQGRASGRHPYMHPQDARHPCLDPHLHAVVHQSGVRWLRPIPDVLHPCRHGGGVHAVGPRAPAVPSECACAVWQPRTMWLADQLGSCERAFRPDAEAGGCHRGLAQCQPSRGCCLFPEVGGQHRPGARRWGNVVQQQLRRQLATGLVREQLRVIILRLKDRCTIGDRSYIGCGSHTSCK